MCGDLEMLGVMSINAQSCFDPTLGWKEASLKELVRVSPKWGDLCGQMIRSLRVVDVYELGLKDVFITRGLVN